MSERLPVNASRSSGAGSTVTPNVAAEWLLTAGERGNLATAIDAAHESGLAWTVEGFEVWRATAAGLEAWHDGGRHGPRPPGRIRPHRVELAAALKARWVPPLCRLAIDPDGRPLGLRPGSTL